VDHKDALDLEGMRAVTANVISARLVSGTHRWLVIGAYLPPSCRPDNELMAIMVEQQRNPWLPVIWLGNFNANLGDDMCEQAVAILTMAQHLRVVDLLHHFKQKYQWHTFYLCLVNGTHQHSWCDYIMVDPTMDVCSLQVINPPCYHSDHLALKIQIPSATNQAHCQYLNNWSQLPAVQAVADEGEPNLIFTQLLAHHEHPVAPAYPTQEAWIATDMWTLIDQHTAALKHHALQEELCTLHKVIRKLIWCNCNAQLQKTGDKIQAHLDANETTKAWWLVKVWYQHYAKATPPMPMDLHQIGQEYHALYMQQPPPMGNPIRGMVTYPVSDEVQRWRLQLHFAHSGQDEPWV